VAELAGAFRISVELVNGADGTHIWGAMYNTQIAGLPGVETQIAREMAVRMRSKPTKTEEAKLSKGTSTHNEAYEFLLRGRYHMQLYSPESRQKAIGYYQQALALDPRFALANAEMARAYRVLSGSAVAAPSEAMTKAEAAASRALAADWELAEAHAALADIKKDQWDWAAAESEYRRALALNPNLAVAHQGYAIYLSVRGKGDAAIEEIQRAIEVDPLGLPTAIHAVAVYYNARHYDQSQQALKRAEGLDPTAPSLWTWMGMVHGANGRFKAAIEAYEKAIGLGDDTAATQCYYGYALARGGRRDQSLKIQEGLKTSGAYVSKVAVAILHAGLNQRERAIESLQEAFAARDPLLQYIRVEEHLDSIRDDRRFREIAAKVGLPE
jgi:serine/threonine-protein kinase